MVPRPAYAGSASGGQESWRLPPLPAPRSPDAGRLRSAPPEVDAALAVLERYAG